MAAILLHFVLKLPWSLFGYLLEYVVNSFQWGRSLYWYMRKPGIRRHQQIGFKR